MGIWAPLRQVEDSSQTMRYSSTWGTLKLGLGLLVFSSVAVVMHMAVKPFFDPKVIQDPLLNFLLPGILNAAAVIAFAYGFMALGYRKTLTLHRDQKQLVLKFAIWGIGCRQKAIDTGNITEWQLENKTPKHYTPQMNRQNRPVGYWNLRVKCKDGSSILLDSAPKEEEIRNLQQNFMSKVSS